MKKVFKALASLFSLLALMEVSTASVILVYQPELPKKN
ncbi:AgrD family cyclic lactone autoinducer peptide [Tepidibacillus infernus]|nr:MULTISPECIES: cyclic lactone autoinducer peptide [Tepidibacillus]GBF10685.1 hypothetical protein HK1_00698 [Tepidibacillus sp. HK-1]